MNTLKETASEIVTQTWCESLRGACWEGEASALKRCTVTVTFKTKRMTAPEGETARKRPLGMEAKGGNWLYWILKKAAPKVHSTNIFGNHLSTTMRVSGRVVCGEKITSRLYLLSRHKRLVDWFSFVMENA